MYCDKYCWVAYLYYYFNSPLIAVGQDQAVTNLVQETKDHVDFEEAFRRRVRRDGH